LLFKQEFNLLLSKEAFFGLSYFQVVLQVNDWLAKYNQKQVIKKNGVVRKIYMHYLNKAVYKKEKTLREPFNTK
jgi:hypothetical protein